MPGEHSEQRTWDEVRAAEPDVVIVMPCGYDADRALEEAYAYADELGVDRRQAASSRSTPRPTSPAPARG